MKFCRSLLAIVFSLLVFAMLSGCSGENSPALSEPAKDGDTVAVHYTGTLEDGTKFDSSLDRGQPLTFSVGGGQMIAGFDAAVKGMVVGEKKTITLSPEQAYGQHDPDMIFTLGHQQFPEDMQLSIGLQISLQTTTGQTVYGIITEITPDYVKVDLNHELAGKTLTFEIELVSITPAA